MQQELVPVVLQPNAGIPATVAIVAGLAADPIGPNAEPIEVLSQRTVEVAGTTATLEEVEWTEDTAFVPAGTRRYSYTIPRPHGDALTFTTTSTTGDYAEHRRVLDAMMRTLELGAG